MDLRFVPTESNGHIVRIAGVRRSVNMGNIEGCAKSAELPTPSAHTVSGYNYKASQGHIYLCMYLNIDRYFRAVFTKSSF